MEDGRPLRLLSLGKHTILQGPKRIGQLILSLSDGVGIRGLSSLYILKAIMRALERELDESEGAVKQPTRRVLPCEYFDLIAGTSTGG